MHARIPIVAALLLIAIAVLLASGPAPSGPAVPRPPTHPPQDDIPAALDEMAREVTSGAEAPEPGAARLRRLLQAVQTDERP